MKIAGNQSAIIEILTLLDKNINLPCGELKCCCLFSNMTDNNIGTHYLTCDYHGKLSEQEYGCKYYIYDIDYDGNKIKSMKLLHHTRRDSNLLNGCVK